MAFENLNQAFANIFANIAHQQTPAGQADIIGKRLQNKLVEENLRLMFPIQVEQLRKTVDFMISEPEKQRLAIEQANAIDKVRAGLELVRDKALHGYKMEQIGLEGWWDTQIKKTPSTVYHIGGDKELTPQEWFKEAAKTGRFDLPSLENMEEFYNKTGTMNYALLKQTEEIPKFGALTTGETEELGDQIKSSAAFEALVENIKNAPGGEKYVKYDKRWLGKNAKDEIFKEIVNGERALPPDNALKQMFDSYRYSTTGVRANIVPRTEIPDFKTIEEYDSWLRANMAIIAVDQDLQTRIREYEKQKGWAK